MALPLFSPTGLLSRLTSIFLGFAPAFLLLSIGYFYLNVFQTFIEVLILKNILHYTSWKFCRYEALFYSSLALALVAWILFENAYKYISKPNISSTSMEDHNILKHDERCLQLSDMRIPLTFVSGNLLYSHNSMTKSAKFIHLKKCVCKFLLSIDIIIHALTVWSFCLDGVLQYCILRNWKFC